MLAEPSAYRARIAVVKMMNENRATLEALRNEIAKLMAEADGQPGEGSDLGGGGSLEQSEASS